MIAALTHSFTFNSDPEMRFLGLILGSFCAVGALWITLNLFRLGEPIENEVRYWCQMVDFKKKIAHQAPSSKVIFVGASNVLYGIRADLVTEKFNLPTVNMGVVSSLGMDIIIDSAKAVLKSGDVAVLAIEYAMFENKDYNGSLIRRELLSCNTDALFALPMRDQAKAILQQPLADVLKGVLQKSFRSVGIPHPFQVTDHDFQKDSHFNSNGDFIQNEDSRVTPQMREWVEKHPGGLTIEFSLESPAVRAVSQLVAWARQNGVTILANWPAVYWPRRDLAAPGLQKIRDFYASLGIAVLGDPADTMLPLEDFFDTNNHLTTEAAKKRTESLVRLMSPFFPPK